MDRPIILSEKLTPGITMVNIILLNYGIIYIHYMYTYINVNAIPIPSRVHSTIMINIYGILLTTRKFGIEHKFGSSLSKPSQMADKIMIFQVCLT